MLELLILYVIPGIAGFAITYSILECPFNTGQQKGVYCYGAIVAAVFAVSLILLAWWWI